MIKEMKEIDEIYLYLCLQISRRAALDGTIPLTEAEQHLSRFHRFPSKKNINSLSKLILKTMQEKKLIVIIPHNRKRQGDEIKIIAPMPEIERLLESYM